MSGRLLIFALAALALPAAAIAAETPKQEVRALARCALATGAYRKVAGPGGWEGATDADRALVQRVEKILPALKARFIEVGATLPTENYAIERDAVTAEFMGLNTSGDGEPPHAEVVVPYYRPVLEDCAARGETLGR